MARASTSSLNAHKSSRLPPPRATMMTSTSALCANIASPRATSSAAPEPELRPDRVQWAPEDSAWTASISRRAALVALVSHPRQGNGSGFFRSSSKRPSTDKRFLRASKAAWRHLARRLDTLDDEFVRAVRQHTASDPSLGLSHLVQADIATD